MATKSFVSRALDGIFGAARLRAYVWASVVSQILIVVTGGAVRLTGSGLGCPTWPKCTEDSLITVPEMGIHGIIEFGNRLLTFVLVLIALLTFVTVWRLGKPERRGMVWPSLSLGLGIFGQAVIGGISVWTNLNPWVVGLHFVLSAALIAIATTLVWRFYGFSGGTISAASKALAWPITVVGYVTIVVGIIVTGAGPHAGDADAPRNGLDLEIWQHVHSYPGYLLISLTIIAFILQRREVKGRTRLNKIQLALLLVEVAQAILGVVQARLGVPPLLVGLHMLGASVLVALFTANLIESRKTAQNSIR
jgi:cytochrome c oxidase assembly protein subunit 15